MFDNICIMGNGVLAKNICRYLSKMNKHITFFDVNETSSWYIKKQIDSIEHAKYVWCCKEKIFDYILEQDGTTLIISAVNPFLIPIDITDNQRFTAINLHHSYLPMHPGRNAEAWAIYEEDEFAGITWHKISSTVDGGDIIAQEKILLDDTITSWKLLKIQNDVAFKRFKIFADNLLQGDVLSVKQEKERIHTLHYSWEKPNSGFVDLSWSGNKMSAFLRSMDYGPSAVMGKPLLKGVDGVVHEISKYLILQTDKQSEESFIEYSQDGINIYKDGMHIELFF